MIRKAAIYLAPLLALPILAGAAQNPPATIPQAAQAPAPAVIGPAKIGFINMAQAITTCDEGKKESGTLQQYVEKKSAELQAKQKELDQKRNQLEVQGSKLTEEARTELAESIEALDVDIQRFQQDTQKDIDNRRQKLQNLIGRKMQASIEKVAKEKGLTVVQFIDANIYGYIDPALLITEEVIKAYNQAYPVAAATAPAKK